MLDSTKINKNAFRVFDLKVQKNPECKAYYTSGFFTQDVWVFLDSNHQKQVLQNPQYYTKSDILFFNSKKFVDGGLFMVDGKEWKRQRNIISEAFHFKNLKSFTPLINKITDDQVKEVVPGEMNEIIRTCSVIAGKVVSATFFGEDFYNQQVNGVSVIEELQYCVQTMSLHKKSLSHNLKQALFPNYGNYNFLLSDYEKKLMERSINVKKFCLDYVNRIISEDNRKQISNPQNLFEILLCEYNKGNISQYEIVMNFQSFLFAGIDTTGNFTGMAFYALAKHQNIQQRVYNSILNYFKETRGDQFDSQNFDILHEDMNKIPELNNFIKEAFRFYNSAPGLLFRTVLQNHKICNFDIPKGSMISNVTTSNMRSEKYFKNCEEFDIDRWDREETSNIDPYAYIPFSAGPRNCLGQHLSIIEIKVMIIKYLMKYRVMRNPEKDIVIGLKIIATPLEEDLVYFEKRK